MNKLLEDFSTRKITYADLVDPEVLAGYALDDPDIRKWLLDSYMELIHQLKYVTTDMRRHNIYYVARVYKEAIDIIDVNREVRGLLPAVNKASN